MDFSLSEEQVLLRDSVEKYVREHCTVERHRALCNSEQGFDSQAWQQFAQLGWLSVPFSEKNGGIEGGATDIMVVCEAFGKGLVREPFLSTVVTCGALLQHGGSDVQQAQYVPGIIDGSAQWALAFAEAQSGYDFSRVETAAQHVGDEYVLSGRKIAVLNAHCANHYIVSAYIQEPGEARTGLTLFIVDADAPGVTKEAFVALDGSRGANLQFADVVLSEGHILGQREQGLALLESAIDPAIVALGAEALGAMQALLDATVEYTKTREQFGQPISKFQALQHRMAEMYMMVEETRSLLLNAAIALDEKSDEAALACAALKVKVSEAGRFVAQQAVQLHGGIGMTDELCVGHHYKRLMLLAKLYGDETYYLQKYVNLSAAHAA